MTQKSGLETHRTKFTPPPRKEKEKEEEEEEEETPDAALFCPRGVFYLSPEMVLPSAAKAVDLCGFYD